MKLRTTLALITAAVGFSTLAAQAQTTTEWVGSADLRYTTSYVFRGDKKAGQSLQANVEFQPVAGQDGFFVGGWANQPFASERDFEFDLYGGYKYNWQQLDVSLEGGLIGYFYPEAGNGETDYTYELYVSATRDIMENWAATATLYYDMRLEAITGELSTGYSIPYKLDKFNASVDFSLFVGYSDVGNVHPDAPGADRGDSYSYYGATISTTVWFTKNLRASVGVQYGDTFNKAWFSSPYGGDGSDNLYGYASVGLKW